MKVLGMVLVLLLMVGTASAIDLQLGTQVDVTIEKDVELENINRDAELSLQHYDLTLEQAIGSWFTLTPRAGLTTAQIELDTPKEIELNSGIGWNVGLDAKADVWSNEYFDLSLIGAYTYSRTDIDEIDLGGIVIDNPIETIMTIHEVEAGARVSKDLSEYGVPVTPYVGLVYSDLMGDIDVNLSMFDLDEDINASENVGIRAGVYGEPIEDLKLGIEIDLLDQTAVKGKVSYLF